MPTIAELIDLSIGSPEVGAVNFNVLHAVLHQLVKETGLAGKSVDGATIDNALLKKPKVAAAAGKGGGSGSGGAGGTGDLGTADKPPYHALMSRINELEDRLATLDSMDNKDINKDVMTLKEHGAPGRKPVSDMWNLLQCQKRSQTNEEMITKLSSMMEDLLSAHQKAKQDNEFLKSKIASFNSLTEDLISKTEALTKRVENLEDLEAKDRKDIDDLKNRMNSAESNLSKLNKRMEGIPEDFTVFATKKDLEDYTTKDEFHKRMSELKEALESKANQKDLEAVQEKLSAIPEDLTDQLKLLSRSLDSLRLDRDSDAENIGALQDQAGHLENDIQKLQKHLDWLMEEGKNTRKSMIELDARVQTLDMVKADKETIQIEIDLKADKRALDSKIGRSLFDEKTGEIDEEIGSLKLRLGGCESDYKNQLDELLKRLDAKLDKDELGPLKEWLENKLKGIKPKLIKQDFMIGGLGSDVDEAAGFRKPLSKAFCISCDRSLDIAPAYPVPSFPSYNPLPPSRSARPYTTYELDQIRAAQRLSYQDPDTVMPYNRPMGGAHTVATNKRLTKAQQLSHMIEAEEKAAATAAEVDLMGIDGRIYKGRTEHELSFDNGTPLTPAHNVTGVELPDIPPPRTARHSSRQPKSGRAQQKLKPSTPAGSEQMESARQLPPMPID